MNKESTSILEMFKFLHYHYYYLNIGLFYQLYSSKTDRVTLMQAQFYPFFIYRSERLRITRLLHPETIVLGDSMLYLVRKK